jgi:Zn-dependent protease
VFVHWTWFVVAVILIRDREGWYTSVGWEVIEYVAGFLLVLLHEFGHVLACRRVGGHADCVVLWPLGGLAFVAPPPKAWADLVTTLAGPLVNLALVPAFYLLTAVTVPADESARPTDIYLLFASLASFNWVMLVFNLVPCYPLDGGRVLQAILWPVVGRPVALLIVAVIGVAAAIGLGLWAAAAGEGWFIALAAFLGLGAVGGVSQARMLFRMRSATRHADRMCPTCKSAPPVGRYWRCVRCGQWIDVLEPFDRCPRARTHWAERSCPECGRILADHEWVQPVGPYESTASPRNSEPDSVNDGPAE